MTSSMEYSVTKVFEDGNPYMMNEYLAHEIESLIESIYAIFRPAPNVDYWFEVDHDETGDLWCSNIYIRCYKPLEYGGQIQIAIPSEYEFLLDRKVRIRPSQLGVCPWSEVVELEFVCL